MSRLLERLAPRFCQRLRDAETERDDAVRAVARTATYDVCTVCGSLVAATATVRHRAWHDALVPLTRID